MQHTSTQKTRARIPGAGMLVAVVVMALVLAVVSPGAARAQDDGFAGTAPGAGGQALLVTSRAIAPVDLAQGLAGAGCTVQTLAVIEAGEWVTWVNGAPAFANDAFPAQLGAVAPFYVRCQGAASGAFNLFSASGGQTVTGTQVDTRVATHDGYDRVVFEFQGDTVPEYDISYLTQGLNQCASGQPVTLDGQAILQVHLPHTYIYDPNTGDLTIPSKDLHFSYPELKEARETCGFEAVANWGLGVASRQPFRVYELSSPARLVIDIQHP